MYKHTCAHNNAQWAPCTLKQAKMYLLPLKSDPKQACWPPNARSRSLPHTQGVVAPLSSQISPLGLQICTCATTTLDQPSIYLNKASRSTNHSNLSLGVSNHHFSTTMAQISPLCAHMHSNGSIQTLQVQVHSTKSQQALLSSQSLQIHDLGVINANQHL